MSNRLVDPVHFFNHEGVAVLTLKHLAAENEKLSNEIERLTRLLRAQIERNRATEDKTDIPSDQ
jgi:hypothetical protein